MSEVEGPSAAALDVSCNADFRTLRPCLCPLQVKATRNHGPADEMPPGSPSEPSPTWGLRAEKLPTVFAAPGKAGIADEIGGCRRDAGAPGNLPLASALVQ